MTETNLPVRAVTLFSSGVAYVLHEGEASAGEAKVELTFRTAQINDVLKSMVLLDSGGTVQPAVYPSQDPIERTLASFAVNVAGNLTQADLLRQLRGTQLKVETDTGEAHQGRLLGVETRKKREVLTLLTDVGMVAVELSRCRQIALLDERRDRELREALAVLAGSSDEARRTLTLGFSGESARTVRVGYITEAPLWKVSYRLVLPDEETGKPYLQGWALVENTTDEDWNGVELSLISGRPVSFIQDLYKPLYLTRPTIPIDTGEMPIPQVNAGAMDEMVMERERGATYALSASMPAPAPMMAAGVPGNRRVRSALRAEELSQSASARAAGEAKGELFAYEISTPVSLPRQQAAMIPIVSENAGGEKLSLYNADTDPKRPQNAVRLTNATALHLKAGPVTVFDGGIYAGDALMDDVPPGDSRLLTYAVDLALEGERIQESQPQRVLKLRLKRSNLRVTFSQVERTIYKFSSKADKTRKVLIEHPFSADWRLVSPDAPAERTRTHYRFAPRRPRAGQGRVGRPNRAHRRHDVPGARRLPRQPDRHGERRGRDARAERDAGGSRVAAGFYSAT